MWSFEFSIHFFRLAIVSNYILLHANVTRKVIFIHSKVNYLTEFFFSFQAINKKSFKTTQCKNFLGGFAEMENLIRSFSQLFYDYIKNFDDDYWLWLIQIRKFLRFVNMAEITESQVEYWEFQLLTFSPLVNSIIM